MTEQTSTETNQIEAGDYINRNNVEAWDEDNPDARYKALNTSSRHTQAGQKGYLLKDRETGEIHITNLNTNLLQPNYRINATNVTLTTDDGVDHTSTIIDDLARGVEYDHFISKNTVRIEYAGESGWPDEFADDNWDVKTDVITE